MSNSFTKLNPITTPLRYKPPGMAEFNALLSLFDDPALLLNTNHFRIVSANSQFFQLTAFSQDELTNITLDALIPGIDMIELLTGSPQEVSLSRHNRVPVQVSIRMLPLENSPQWSLLYLIPIQKNARSQVISKRQKELYKLFHSLTQLTDQPDLDSALYMAIDIGTAIICSDILCIYSADSEKPRLLKVKSIGEKENPILPDSISSADLSKLTSPSMWVPGKRVATELQRIARINNFSSIATVALGQHGAWSGLLVAVNLQTPPEDDLLDLLEVIAGHITSAMQNYVSLANTNAVIKQINKVLPVQKSVIENTLEGIIILNHDLTIQEMNPAVELMLGYSITEVVGQSIDNILIGTESIKSVLNSAMNGIPTQNLGSLNLHRRNGQSFPAQLQSIPVLVDGVVSDIVILLTDHSEDEQSRIKTQQLEQRAVLGEITAIFAHEVKNPINNISLNLQSMAANLPSDSPLHEMAIRLQGDCTRLIQLMESVLSFSKGTEYNLEPIDIRILIQRLLDRWRPRFANAKVQPYLQSSLPSPKVRGDPRALDQVFTNLISNAVNAMQAKGGMLAIKLDLQTVPEDPPQIIITITDNGSGIPEDILSRMFEPFVTTNAQQGTGLGLAITKRIITAHRGNINVDSFPGGTVFTIKLPAVISEV